MGTVWLELSHSLQPEYGLPQTLLLTVPHAPLTTLCSVSFAHHFPLLNYFVWPAVMSFGTNASFTIQLTFTIQFTSVLFSLVRAIKIAPLGNNVIANKSK